MNVEVRRERSDGGLRLTLNQWCFSSFGLMQALRSLPGLHIENPLSWYHTDQPLRFTYLGCVFHASTELHQFVVWAATPSAQTDAALENVAVHISSQSLPSWRAWLVGFDERRLRKHAC